MRDERLWTRVEAGELEGSRWIQNMLIERFDRFSNGMMWEERKYFRIITRF